MKKFLIALSVLSTSFAYSADIDDLATYDCGKSLSWFFNMREQATRPSYASRLEKDVLQVLQNSKISDEAFRLACKILKPIASDDSIKVLAKFLTDDIRAVPALDVLIGIDDGDVDDVLIDALKKAKGKAEIEIIFAMGCRGEDDFIKPIIKKAESSNNDVALASVSALARIDDDDAVDALLDISAKNDFRKDYAVKALCAQAEKLFAEGEKSDAIQALTGVPEDCTYAVALRGKLAGKNRTQYLDSLIIAGGKTARYAARAMSEGRKYEESSMIISKFDSMSDSSKIMAIASFMNTGDVRFWNTVKPYLDAVDSNLRAEAIYSARFICADESSLEKIYNILKSNAPCCQVARNVMLENSSLAVQRVLNKAYSKGDPLARELLIYRGDLVVRDALWADFFSGKADKKAIKLLEDSILYGELRAFASKFKEVKDIKIRSEMAKIIIKRFAKARDKDFIKSSVPKVLDGNLPKDSEEYKLIVSKLKI